MAQPEDWLRHLARALSGLGVGLACLVLVGWYLDVEALQVVVPGLPKTTANTAIGILLLGASLLLSVFGRDHPARRALAKSTAALGLAVGALTLLEYAADIHLGIDELLFIEDPGAPTAIPGRPSPQTSATLALLGLGLLLLDARSRATRTLSQLLALGALLIALLAFYGHLYGATELIGPRRFLPYTGMGVITSVALVLESAAALLAVPGPPLTRWLADPSIVGSIARRGMLLLVVLAPLGLALVFALGRGLGLYDWRVEAALRATSWTLLGAYVVTRISTSLARIEARREEQARAIERSEARLSMFLELAPDAVIIIDESGRILRVNEQVREIFGYEVGELVGQSVDVLLPEARRSIHAERRDEYLEDLHPRTMGAGRELAGRRKDGGELPVEVRVSGHRTTEGVVMTAIVRDISDRRAIEAERARLFVREQEARREAEREHARLLAVVENAPIGILFVEQGLQRVVHNEEFRRLLGGRFEYDPERVARIRKPDGRSLSLEELPSIRALRGEAVQGEALRILRPDGSSVPVLASAAPVRDETGEVAAACLTLLDVSSREELARVREEYLGLVSHDLKNPLAGIMLRAQLLGRALAARGDEADLKNVRMMLEAGQRMTAMIDELRDVTRLEAGGFPLERRAVEPARFFANVVERALPERERARVVLRVAPGARPFEADPARLERVFVNLLTNAVKYGDPEAPIEVRVRSDERGVTLRVENEGPPLTPEQARRIFEKHYRAPGAERRAEGLGLGLYISRLLVEAHGGRIHAESDRERGAAFVVELPTSAEVGAAVAQPR